MRAQLILFLTLLGADLALWSVADAEQPRERARPLLRGLQTKDDTDRSMILRRINTDLGEERNVMPIVAGSVGRKWARRSMQAGSEGKGSSANSKGFSKGVSSDGPYSNIETTPCDSDGLGKGSKGKGKGKGSGNDTQQQDMNGKGKGKGKGSGNDTQQPDMNGKGKGKGKGSGTSVPPDTGCSPDIDLTPVALNDNYSVPANTQLVRPATSGVLINDRPSGVQSIIQAQPQHGTITLQLDGSFTYTPAKDFVGIDYFTYIACIVDGDCSSPATVTIDVTGSDRDSRPPQAVDDNYSTQVNTPLIVPQPGFIINDILGTEPVTAVINTQPTNGNLTSSPNGSFSYTPSPGFVGMDNFTYSLCDENASCSEPATVTIDVTGSDRDNLPPPQAVDDNYSTPIGTPLVVNATLGVQENDPEYPTLLISEIVSQPEHGTVTLGSDGSFRYLPESGFEGTDTFTYKNCEAGGECSEAATVTIEITPVNLSNDYGSMNNLG